MKKFVLALFVAMQGMIVPPVTAMPMHQTGISDPAEVDAYRNAITQGDPRAKAEMLQDFLKRYPHSAVSTVALDELINAYQAAKDLGEPLNVEDHLLQLDPGRPEVIFMSVFIKKNVCDRTGDAKSCDDAAEMAQRGLNIPKPPDTSQHDWEQMTETMYPVYYSAIALDNLLSKKDVKTAIQAYRTELMLNSVAETTAGVGLTDTLHLAEAYTKPEVRDVLMACWLYARVWNFAPATYKAEIEQKLEYWYNRYNGSLKNLDDLKARARTTLFPPTDFNKNASPTRHPQN